MAIAMATYEPDAAMFEIQIESIRAQTHRNWICLISDDGSGPEARELIERVAGGDPRFAIDFAAGNQGFYANFERALAMVPPEADHVALSDQDDQWRADKLERLLAGLSASRARRSPSATCGSRPLRAAVADTYWSSAPSTTPTSAPRCSPTR